MSLRLLLSSTPETLQDMETAAEDRYWEGWELATQGLHVGAIYILGYAAEMLLKVSSFRVDGVHPGDPVGPRLGPARTYGKLRFPNITYDAGHSVEFWAAFLREKRVDHGRPLSTTTSSELFHRTSRIHTRWLVSLRYRSLALPPLAAAPIDFPIEVLQMTDDIAWIRTNHVALRS